MFTLRLVHIPVCFERRCLLGRGRVRGRKGREEGKGDKEGEDKWVRKGEGGERGKKRSEGKGKGNDGKRGIHSSDSCCST